MQAIDQVSTNCWVHELHLLADIYLSYILSPLSRLLEIPVNQKAFCYPEIKYFVK